MENPSVPGGIRGSLHTQGTSGTATVQGTRGWRCPRAEEAPGHLGRCLRAASPGGMGQPWTILPSLKSLMQRGQSQSHTLPHPAPSTFFPLPASPTSLTLGAAGMPCEVLPPSWLLSPLTSELLGQALGTTSFTPCCPHSNFTPCQGRSFPSHPNSTGLSGLQGSLCASHSRCCFSVTSTNKNIPGHRNIPSPGGWSKAPCVMRHICKHQTIPFSLIPRGTLPLVFHPTLLVITNIYRALRKCCFSPDKHGKRTKFVLDKHTAR